jgi:predicted nucleic acid-binding protein
MPVPTYQAAYILDASVAAKWFVRYAERDREKAIALRARPVEGRTRLIVPEFALLELVNASRYRPRATEADGAGAVALLESLHLQIERLSGDLLRKAHAIAWAHRLAVYDAAYVALAELQGFPLIIAADAFLRKMRGHSIVVALRDLDLS